MGWFGWGKPRILVVDDDATIGLYVREALETEGFKVEEAADGAQALKKLESGKYAIMLLDYQMPKVNGIQVLERMTQTKMCPGMPIVMLTAHSDIDLVEQISKYEIAGYIVKPFTAEKIIMKVRSELDAKK